MPIFLGWLLGIVIGLVLSAPVFASLAIALPTIILPALFGPVLGILGALAGVLPLAVALLLVLPAYLLAYIVATRSVAPALPPVTFPLAAPLPPTGTVPVPFPPFAGELFARGLMIGMTAAINAAPFLLLPVWGPVSATWIFFIISLSIVTPVARNRVYHGFLGWSAWIFLLSYLATAVGLLLFTIAAPIAIAAGGIGAIRIDWSTGTIETSGGLTPFTAFPGGFSLGNFIYIATVAVRDNPLAPGLSSHETGHTLNTAALGGAVLWINAIDENIAPFAKHNLAYGELTAESHTMALPGTARVEFFVRLWG